MRKGLTSQPPEYGRDLEPWNNLFSPPDPIRLSHRLRHTLPKYESTI